MTTPCDKEKEITEIHTMVKAIYTSVHGNGSQGLKTVAYTALNQTRAQWALIVIIIGALVGLAIGK